jgi:hypothetical protein
MKIYTREEVLKAFRNEFLSKTQNGKQITPELADNMVRQIDEVSGKCGICHEKSDMIGVYLPNAEPGRRVYYGLCITHMGPEASEIMAKRYHDDEDNKKGLH